MSQHIFYPMLTGTLKSILSTIDPESAFDYILLILNYPNTQDSLVNMKNDPIAKLIIDELNRQYMRWNKQGRD